MIIDIVLIDSANDTDIEAAVATKLSTDLQPSTDALEANTPVGW